MLRGPRISLRPTRSADIDTIYAAHIDIQPVPVAEKRRFTLEGTVRDALFNGGRNHDVPTYSLVRDDPRPWHEGAPSR